MRSVAGGFDQGPDVAQQPVGGDRRHGQDGGLGRVDGYLLGLGHRRLPKSSG